MNKTIAGPSSSRYGLRPRKAPVAPPKRARVSKKRALIPRRAPGPNLWRVIDLTEDDPAVPVHPEPVAPHHPANFERVRLEDVWDSRTTLNFGGWLNDVIMLSFMRRLAAQDDTVGYLDSLSLQANRTLRAKNRLYKKIRGRDRVLLPVCNQRAKHWTLYAIFPGEKTLRHYDSLFDGAGREAPEAISDQSMDVLMFAAWLYGDEGDEDLWSVRTEPSYQQKNADDCGVFTIRHAMHVADREDVPARALEATGYERPALLDLLMRRGMQEALFAAQLPLHGRHGSDWTARICAPFELGAWPGEIERALRLLPRQRRRLEEVPDELCRLDEARAVSLNAEAARRLHNMHRRALLVALKASTAKEEGEEEGSVVVVEREGGGNPYSMCVALLVIIHKMAERQEVDREKLVRRETELGCVFV